MIKAVIFDFDGVVANTMKDNCKSWQSALAVHDIHIEPLEYYLLEGMGRFQISDFFIKKYGLDHKLRYSIAKLKEDFYERNNNFEIYSEILEIFHFLSTEKLKMGLVTGASKERVMKCVGEEILNFLNFVITADDVTNSKPDPEPYLRAIQRLGIVPSEALVIENAHLGIQSAKAAGCKCYAIETTLAKEYLSEADEVFNTHKELLVKFKTIFKS